MTRPEAPPHYALPGPRVAAPNAATAAFATAFVLISALSFVEVCWLTPRAYDAALPGWLPLLAALLGLRAAAGLTQPGPAVPAALALLGATIASSGYVWTWAFESAAAFNVCRWLLPSGLGLAWGMTWSLCLRGFSARLREHRVLSSVLAPLPIALFFVCWVGALLTFPGLGILRRAVVSGTALVGLALFAERLVNAFQVGARPRPRLTRWSLMLAPLVCALAFFGAETRVPLQAIKRYSPEVLYCLSTPYREHVFIRLQGGLLMFSDGVLGFTSSDGPRFAEALVHPALATSRRAADVLAIVDGTGFAEREILRWSGVEHVIRLTQDPELSRFSARSAAFREPDRVSFEDPRLESRTEEPSRFVLSSPRQFDVIVADFGDPISYEIGKYYSAGFLGALRRRLAPGGVLAMPITSELRTPRTQASILASLEAAGFKVTIYRAPLPVLGEWGFALATARDEPGLPQTAKRRFPSGTSFVTAGTLAGLFAQPNTAAAPAGAVNHLYAQPAVELYLHEETSSFEAPKAQRHAE